MPPSSAAWETLPAIETCRALDPSDRRHSIWYFFGGFAELLLRHTEAAVALLEKSLERNPSYGAAQLFLMAALSLTGRNSDAARIAESFRRHHPESPADAFERFWLSRSPAPAYRAQIYPLFESNLRHTSSIVTHPIRCDFHHHEIAAKASYPAVHGSP